MAESQPGQEAQERGHREAVEVGGVGEKGGRRGKHQGKRATRRKEAQQLIQEDWEILGKKPNPKDKEKRHKNKRRWRKLMGVIRAWRRGVQVIDNALNNSSRSRPTQRQAETSARGQAVFPTLPVLGKCGFSITRPRALNLIYAMVPFGSLTHLGTLEWCV